MRGIIEKESKTRRNPESSSSFLSVALVEPEFAINIGYVARAMANFGLEDLIIVSAEPFPRTKLTEAERFASHGSSVLRKVTNVRSLEQVRKKFKFLVGTTAIRGRRKGNLTRKTLGVEECAKRVYSLLQASKKKKENNQLCLVLGRDTTGLTNDELRKCDFTTTIDTGSAYNTLNLSHALTILLYVFLRLENGRQYSAKKERRSHGKVDSSRKEKERVIRLFEELASSSDFQGFKRAKLQETMARLLGRSDPSLRELYLLMGLASKANAKIKRMSAYANLR